MYFTVNAGGVGRNSELAAVSTAICRYGLAAEEPPESPLQVFLGEELLRPGRRRRRVVVDLTIEQKLGGVDEHLGWGPAGVNGDQFDARALLKVEVKFHGLKAMPRSPGAVNGTLVTSAIFRDGLSQARRASTDIA